MPQFNYLLIGIGGTGCAVVRELKKKLYVEWRSRGNIGPYPEIFSFPDDDGTRIATLSIDSNEKDLAGEGELLQGWRVFGETLRLEDREKVLLDPTGLDGILSSIERYPGIDPWVRGDMDFVRDITRGTNEPAGCNQIRRMGRLALANGNGIENVKGAIANRLKELTRNRQVDTEIHIACTLAAGTGSGSLIDVVAQLQRHLRNASGDYKVFIHGFTTVNDVGSINVGNFYANQYAALMELNAFRLGIYEPWDIAAFQRAGRLALPKEEGKSTRDLRGTFKSVALVSDYTEGGVNVPLERQIDNVAEFIFQVAVRQMGDLPKALRDALTGEDRPFPADANGGNRSTAFIGYGVQRVAIPEREIREKLSYSFSRQFVLKALYNYWDDRYRETPREFSRDAFVDKRRRLWKATRDHLYLDLVENAAGQPVHELYETEWKNELKRQEDRVREQLADKQGRLQWPADFERRAALVWTKGFRNQGEAGGVIDYFKIRKEPNEISTRARRMSGNIEKDLIFGIERLDPEYALTHLPEAMAFLVTRIDDDRKGFGDLERDAVEEVKKTDRTRAEIRAQYQKCGIFAKGKQERLFTEFVKATTSFYYWQTIMHAAQYGQVFSLKLLEELTLLQNQIREFDTRLKLLAKNFDTEISVRISEINGPKSSEEVEYLVEAQYINESIKDYFEKDKELQDLKAFVAMDKLKQLRGDRVEFAAYTEKMPVDDTNRVGGTLVDEIFRISEQSAIEAHRQICEGNKDFKGILGQNIVNKLYNKYGGRMEGKLEQWLRDLIGKAMPMVSFNPTEEKMDLQTQGPVLRRCVFLPKCSEKPEFEQQLRDKINAIIGGGGSCKIVETFCQEVPEDRNPTEITIISVAFFFSARFARVVHGLKTKYLERLQQKSDRESRRAYFEVHTESHQPPLPDLMKLGRKEELKGGFPLVLLAYSLGLMHVPEADGQEVPFGKKNDWGEVEDKVLSKMMINAELRKIAAESATRFGREIPIEMIVLYTLYLEQFNEDGLPLIERLVRSEMEKDVNVDAVQNMLKTMSGQSFLLSGKREDDVMYQFFNEKSKEAAELALRFSDKTSLKRL